MGSVWVAEQKEPVRRRVALKLVKPGMDSRQVLHRFEAERQALAAMDHPNIARVLDGGLTDNQHPFFAMELVNGANLTKFCDEARLGIRERLEIFRQIVLAIQHAHHKGILHRDLKPSNILVTVIDGKPVPKVIDFGLAKVLGSQVHVDSLQTNFGAVVGTLEYMAPEQAGYSGQDVDTRADIYSLGVILYELLTGLRPFNSDRLASAALDEMLRIIKDEEPVRPSIRLSSSDSALSCAEARRIEPTKLSGILRNELDWVVMKALDKDRNRRYETANGLATDIQNYLVGEPVSAHPPSLAYRARKYVRRHRVQVIAASLVSFGLIAGVAGLAFGFFQAKKQEGIALEQKRIAVEESEAKAAALEREQKARAREKEARDQALEALRSMTDEFISNELARETPISRKEQTYLRNIIKQFDAFSEVSAEDAEGAAIRGEGRYRVGRIYNYLGQSLKAETELRKSVDIFVDLVRLHPQNDEYRRRLVRSQNGLANTLVRLGKTGDAMQLHEDCLAYWTEISATAPTIANLDGKADTCASIGQLHQSVNRPDEAEKLFKEVLEIRKKILEKAPRIPAHRERLAGSLQNLAGLYRQQDRNEDAEKMRKEALSLRSEIADRYSARPDFVLGLSRSLRENGTAALSGRQWSDAESAFEEACRILDDLAEQFPSRHDYKEELADALSGLSRSLDNQKRYRESMTALAKAIIIREELAAESPERPEFRKDLAVTGFNLGRVYRRLGKLDEAEEIWRQAISIRKAIAAESADDHSNKIELIRVLHALGQLHDSESRVDEAISCCEQAIAIEREGLTKEPSRIQLQTQLASSLLVLGRVLSKSTRFPESEAVMLESRSIRQRLAAENPADLGLQGELADCSIDLGGVWISKGDFTKAEKFLSEAMEIIQDGLSSDSDDKRLRAKHARAQFFIIQIHAGKLNEAEALAEATKLRDLGWDPPENAFFAACGLARSVNVVNTHSLLNEQEREATALRYSNLAMEYLTDAVNKGLTSRSRLESDSDLDSLRGRDDFKKLLDGLPADNEPKPDGR
jgi:eukaryotic-like serine/threonine-protein kinase